MKGLLGRKVGMTQVFSEEGKLIPVTVVEVEPNVVLQKKTEESDGYNAVQLGAFDKKEARANKSEIAHAAKANTAPKKFVREIVGDSMLEYEVGTEIKADLFESGEFVDVSGISRGKGYQGAIVRNNQALGPKSHGSKFHRGIGSLATGGMQSMSIKKGAIMPGQTGGYVRTIQNLEVVQVNAEENYLLIKGNVPGPRKGFVVIKSAVKKKGAKTDAVELIDRTKEDSENA